MKRAPWWASIAGAVMGVAGAAQVQAHDRPVVVLISIDGLRPDAITEADAHGLAVPHLRAFMRDGAWASGVRGVLPTLTYPSHASILTGTAPSRHGILSNTTFDPLRRNQRGWYWYAEDVRVPTLWDAAAAAHLTTANVYWPISVGAPITFNLPQIWRTGTDDDLKLQRALGTPGLERALSRTLGRYPGGMEEGVEQDETRARFAQRLFDTRHPDFMTIYFTGLDTEQHASGPFSAASNAVLERIDALIGRLREDIERNAPGRATICVVSDHGFAAVTHDVNLPGAFLSAGLFSVNGEQDITAWQAMPWPAGGGAAVMLADPADEAVRTRVGALLRSLAADPANGIDRVLTPAELVRAEAFPEAAFYVSLANGYELGDRLHGPLITASANGGMHGYLPDRPEMRASLFVVGPHVRAGRPLGEIDMRQIAPTLAMILHVPLPQAEGAPLRLQ